MKRYCGDIYRKARDLAGMTQEEAAPLICISTRTLAAYEIGELKPPPETVEKMCEVYGAEWLAYLYFQSTSSLGRRYLPKIDFSNLPITVLRFQKEMVDAEKISGEMVEVACDGVIGYEEKESWQKVEKEVKELVGAGMALLFTQKEKEPQPSRPKVKLSYA